MKCRWQPAPPQPLLTRRLADALGVSPLLAQCLVNRGLADPAAAAAFLEPRLKRLADPFRLPAMAAAVDRLLRARERGELVAIYGDYDVDGVTSTALLTEVLGALGCRVAHFLPHRLDEGYGLSPEGVAHCLAQHDARVLLAVDCGSTAVATVAGLNARGVDVLVLDHHQVSAPPPAALALVNPRLNGAPSHGTELCSAGLAFKLAHALVKRGRELGLAAAHRLDLKALLDLVALGTIADLVPLAGENRILVTAGLERLNETRRPGLQALCEVAGLRTRIGTHEVGYLLGPRLNAAGRLEDAREALDLLLAGDFALATPIAHSLDARNRQRQEIERGIAAQVVASLGQRFNPDTDFVIVEGELLWHIGVVGIVASRVLSQFYRPTIIVGGDGAHWRGSGRSIEGFDLAAALRECDDLLVRHGGHAMAAGLTIAADKLPALRTRLNDLARRTLAPEQLRPPLRLDAETDLAELGSERLHELARLAPTGQGNPPVQVVVRGLGLTREPQRIGAEKKHAKFWAGHGGGESVECVWWGCGERPLPAGRFDLACAPQLHAYNGREYVQLKVLDWRPA